MVGVELPVSWLPVLDMDQTCDASLASPDSLRLRPGLLNVDFLPVSETYLRPTILTALQPTVSVLNTLQLTDEIHFKLSSSSLTADHIVLDGGYLLTLAGNQRMVVVKEAATILS